MLRGGRRSPAASRFTPPAPTACRRGARPAAERHSRAAPPRGAGEGGGRRRGAGLGCMWYGIGNTSMSNPSTMRVGLGRDGVLTLYSGAVDIGQGANTIMTQLCADALGVSVAELALVTGDTDRTADA